MYLLAYTMDKMVKETDMLFYAKSEIFKTKCKKVSLCSRAENYLNQHLDHLLKTSVNILHPLWKTFPLNNECL